MDCPVCTSPTLSTTTYEDGSTSRVYACGSYTNQGSEVLATSRTCRDQLLSELAAVGTGDADLDARVNAAASGEGEAI